MPGQYDRYNMRRQVTLTANVSDADLGRSRAKSPSDRAGRRPPTGVQVEIRGQIPPMREMQSGWQSAWGSPSIAVFLLLTANFQSVRLALVDRLHSSGRRGRRGADAVAHGHDAQHPVVHRRDHGDRRGDGQRDPAGDVRRTTPTRRADAPAMRQPAAPRAGCGQF